MPTQTPSQTDKCRFDKVLTDYERWKSEAAPKYATRIAAMQSLIASAGEHHFHDYLDEAVGDFMNRMTSLCVPQYGPAWIDGYHKVSQWVSEHAVRSSDDRLLAICSSRGIDRVEAIIASLAVGAAPETPMFSPRP
jgi:hypothetical protein